MKFCLQNPQTGGQVSVDIDDEHKVRHVIDKTIGEEVDGELLGFAGYTFKITGGSDKDGFPMKQGVRVNTRVKLLLPRGSVGYKAHWGRDGERKRKTVRGCIVGHDIRVLNMTVVQAAAEAPAELAKLHNEVPCLLLPKRASKIRRLLDLGPTVDVRKEVPVKTHTTKGGKKPGKTCFHRVKVQRLVTPAVRRRREQKAVDRSKRFAKSRELRTEYQHKVDRLAKLRVQRAASKKQRVRAAQVKVAASKQ
eukprot:TRINITY_DN2494_c0_g1_i1.p1 TRINITY_DN2494_c0_g1~~TRINITY_DN2494_c0_g1_i1.p1  ORF type:complete len:250 (-),score=72.83 TRINITY_DN2494_c0_g1_i1:475-1224(-)